MIATAAAAALAFGAFTGDPYDGTLHRTQALQDKTQRRVEIVSWYQQWTPGEWIAQVHPDMIRAVVQSGRTPMLTWEPWDPARGPRQPRYAPRRIADGAFDGYVRRFADGLRETKTTVYIRPMHEMVETWYPWGGHSPRQYKRAWRHLHEVFARRGATNVRWVWTPSADGDGRRMMRYYPGDRYVDVVGLDGYNWGARHPEWGCWRSFREIFAEPYRRITRATGKPFWITEVGSAPEGGSKPRWIRGMFRTARRWDRLRAIVWFDTDKEADWRAAPDAATAAAFRP